MQRIFRMLYLIQPEENFIHIWSGLQSMSRRDRASSLELLENVLGAEQRRVVVALVEPGPKRERLRRTGNRLSEAPLEYSELLSQIGRDDSRTLHGLAMYHADEMGLDIDFGQIVFEPQVEGSRMSVREQALALIERLPDGPAFPLGAAVSADV